MSKGPAKVTAAQYEEERLFPSVWAERHRVIGRRPWSFAGREYLRAIHDDFSRRIVVKKAAQMGFTELGQNRLAHSIAYGISAMMVLPTDEDAKRHSKARFKELCESSPYIGEMFQEIDSVDVKRSRDAAIYFEGTNSSSAAYSVPVGFLIIDERDRCDKEAVAAYDRRLDGHDNPCRMDISTPTRVGQGVSDEFNASDAKRWFVECHACDWRGSLHGDGEFQTWPCVTWENHPEIPPRDRVEEVAQTARIKCPGCGATWTEKQRKAAAAAGEWVATNPGRLTSGYAINQLCSPTKPLVQLVLQFFRAHYDPNPHEMREFVNQQLGEPYVGEGESITEPMVRALVVPAFQVTTPSLAIGADVGKTIHAVLGGRWGGKLHVLRSYEVDGWDDLDDIVKATGAQSVVVDMNPERRDSEEFCLRHPGVAFRAYHPEGMRSTYNWDASAAVIQIAHAAAVDLLLNRIRSKTIQIHGAGEIEQLVRHLLNVNVVLEESAKGIEERRVVKSGPDHLAFACVYLEAAASRFVDESYTPNENTRDDDAFASARSGEFAGASDSWASGERDPLRDWAEF